MAATSFRECESISEQGKKIEFTLNSLLLRPHREILKEAKEFLVLDLGPAATLARLRWFAVQSLGSGSAAASIPVSRCFSSHRRFTRESVTSWM
jgi:hypothetical protein